MHAFPESRIVFYPGSGHDGHPIKLFGGTHAAHCFVFADDGIPMIEYKARLEDAEHNGHPNGYQPLEVRELRESELDYNSYTARAGRVGSPPAGPGFALLAILDRRADFDEEHGPTRIAILVVGADVLGTFQVLFRQVGDQPAPFAVVLQDHGFGGCLSRWGGNSGLWRVAAKCAPRWFLVAGNSEPWPGYTCVSSADAGGQHNHPRCLYERNLDS